MKISVDLRLAHLPGGGREYASKLISSLVRQYSQIQWRLYHNPWSQPQQKIIGQLQSLNRSNTDNHLIELCPVRSSCLSLRQHLEFFRFRDDACLFHYLHFDLPLGMRGIPLVLTIHDLYPLILPGYCSVAKRAYFYHLARTNALRAACIITISQRSRKDIVERLGIREDKIVVIPQSHSQNYHPITDDDLLARTQRKYHLPARFIFYTGNHKPHKNLERLIRAYARLPKSLRQNYPLLLTGRVSKTSRTLLGRLASLGIDRSVRFLGWVPEDDLPALYNLAHLLVLPSLYEGFGLAALEAMACGTAIACSQVAAIPEVVGQVGRVFDPYSINDIAAAIIAALENDADNPEVRQACLDQAAKFTPQRTAEQTFAVYRSIMRP